MFTMIVTPSGCNTSTYLGDTNYIVQPMNDKNLNSSPHTNKLLSWLR